MLRSYAEITDKMGPPLWWDGNGVPRYVPFAPRQCGVYDAAVALVTIACQDCGAKFNVAFEYDRYEMHVDGMLTYKRPDAERLHWGDPPNHGCVGDTMNCEDLRVLEWWEKPDFDWVRVPEMEVVLPDHPDFVETKA